MADTSHRDTGFRKARLEENSMFDHKDDILLAEYCSGTSGTQAAWVLVALKKMLH